MIYHLNAIFKVCPPVLRGISLFYRVLDFQRDRSIYQVSPYWQNKRFSKGVISTWSLTFNEKKNVKKKEGKIRTISTQDKMTDSNLKVVKATNKDAYLKWIYGCKNLRIFEA